MHKTQKEMMAEKGYITADEAAERVGVTTSRIYEWLNEKKIEGIDVGDGKRPRRYVLATSLTEHVGPEAAKVFGLV